MKPRPPQPLTPPLPSPDRVIGPVHGVDSAEARRRSRTRRASSTATDAKVISDPAKMILEPRLVSKLPNTQ